jgi:tetratricopeptide (TPR) repeat protein
MNSLGVVYRNRGKYSQAEAILVAALAARRRVLGEQHNDTWASMNSLALVYQAQGKYEQAEHLLQQVVEARQRVMSAEHPETLLTMKNLAELYQRQERMTEAEALFTKILEARRRVLGPNHPNTYRVLASLGVLKLQERHYSEAEPLLRQAVQGYRKINTETWRRYYTESMLGGALAGSGKNSDAEPLLVSGYRGMIQRQSSIPFENRPELDEARTRIVQLYQAWGRPSQASAWRDSFPPR